MFKLIRRWWRNWLAREENERKRRERARARRTEFPNLFNMPTPVANEASRWLFVDRYFEPEAPGPKE